MQIPAIVLITLLFAFRATTMTKMAMVFIFAILLLSTITPAFAFVEDLCTIPFGAVIPGTNPPRPYPAGHFNRFQAAFALGDACEPNYLGSDDCVDKIVSGYVSRQQYCKSTVNFFAGMYARLFVPLMPLPLLGASAWGSDR